MSSFSLTSRSSWPQYGPIPLTRYPDCPRQESLKWSICKTNDNDNLDVSSLHARAYHIERGIRLDLAPIALFSLDFLVIPSNLGFRVHVVVFRS
jgi:hypothetical protein